MIKIIKEGKKTKFIKTCPDCGCEFEYEAEDLQTDYTICLTSYPCKYNTYVICPCCGRHIHHGTTMVEAWPIYTTTNGTDDLDCSKCPNRPDPNKPVFGDTPCTWCIKRRPTCTSTISDTIVNPMKEEDYKWYKQMNMKDDEDLESSNNSYISYPGLDDNGELVVKCYIPESKKKK